MNETPARFLLDVERLRALVAANPDIEAPSIHKALADYDAYAVAGKKPAIWIDERPSDA